MARGGSKSGLNVDDAAELLALRQELSENRKDTEELRLEVAQIRTDIGIMNVKQTEVVDVVGGMQESVELISAQLNTVAKAINSLRQKSPEQAHQPEQPAGPRQEQEQEKSPTLQRYQQPEQLSDELRARLLLEQQKTQYMQQLSTNNLPPINTARRSAPPGFAGFNKNNAIHVDTMQKESETPVLKANSQNNNLLKHKWEGYARDYEREMRMQFFKSITKGPRMDFPKFDGENPVGWIRQCEKYFQMAAAPEEYKVHLAQLYFVGAADVWLRRSNLHRQQLSWTRFAEEVTHRFSSNSTYELAEKFNSIKQNSLSIKQYTEVFENLMADIREENPDLQESWFVRCYVNGLKDSIKSQLRPLNPSTLTEAYWKARDMEQCQPVKKQFIPPFQKFSNQNSYRQNSNFTPIVSKVPEAMGNKQKQKDCWRCGEPNWQPTHRCRQIPVLNFLAQALEQTQQEIDQMPTEHDEEQEETPNSEQPKALLASISLQAMGQKPSNATPTVQVTIMGRKAIALLDSGSSNSFMDLSFALKSNCTIQNSEETEVKVAGGGILLSNSSVVNCPFSIAKHQFQEDFKVLNLPGHDLILGCDWFSKHSPFMVDFKSNTVTVMKDGKPAE